VTPADRAQAAENSIGPLEKDKADSPAWFFRRKYPF